MLMKQISSRKKGDLTPHPSVLIGAQMTPLPLLLKVWKSDLEAKLKTLPIVMEPCQKQGCVRRRNIDGQI